MYRQHNVRRLCRMVSLGLFYTAAVLVGFNACLVDEYCYSDADCEAPKICLTERGVCGYECAEDEDCGPGLVCFFHRCVTRRQAPVQDAAADAPTPHLDCPEDMVNVGDSFCVDRFEASRPDATEEDQGADESYATSRYGVLPWRGADNQTARQACLAAGKDLCPPNHWKIACEGSRGTVYGYGNTYEPQTCNGIDTYGRAGLRLLPTGILPDCRSDWGAYDMNGNLWEHVLGGDERTIRGGAYNCIDSQTLHRCDYIPGDWTPSARGFRCCLIPDTEAPDAGEDASQQPEADANQDVSEDGLTTEAAADAEDGEAGCLDEDASADAEPDVSADAEPDVVDAGDEPHDAAPDTSEAGVDATDDGTAPDAEPPECPDGMILITDFCMDIYEASHEDATSSSYGTSPVAASQPDVLPWYRLSTDVAMALSTARTACANADKRLCQLDEWISACEGPHGWDYAYGDAYDPLICNSLDTYCRCSSAACSSLVECPYPACYDQPSPEGGGPCGSSGFTVMPTGSFDQCVSYYGAYDVSGNVWELVDTTDGLAHYRGGAYNCNPSPALHRCDHDGTWTPDARGFRCCRDLP